MTKHKATVAAPPPDETAVRYLNLYWGNKGPRLADSIHDNETSANCAATRERIACLRISIKVDVL